MKKGFTLVELLVVIAIIGMLMSLLVPAVQSARESARQVTCQNNMKQITTAILGYEAGQKFYPPGRRGCDGGCGSPKLQEATGVNSSGASGFVYILPQLELGNLYRMFNEFRKGAPEPGINDDSSKNWSTPGMLNAFKERPGMYVCPTSTTEEYAENQTKYATSCYALSSGSNGPSKKTADNVKFRNNGVFMYIQRMKAADMKDGLSQTFFVGEVLDGHLKISRNAWVRGVRHLDMLRSTENPLNTKPGAGIVYDNANAAFGSNHTGGGYFSYGDGHVVFINDTVDISIYRGLSTRAGDENITLEDY